MPSSDRLSYDTGVSAGVQGDIGSIIGRLESLISQRQSQVNTAMANFQADGVSDDYHAVEQRWNRASTEVQGIITLVKSTLGQNDETATGAHGKARSAVQNIG